jgi:anti-sigma factor RsiW
MDRPEKDNLEYELSQYLDGQLSGRRARKVQRELERSPELQEDLKKYAALDGLLTGAARQGAPGVNYDAQRAEVLRMLERRRLLEGRQRRPIVLRPVFALGGGLALAAALVVGFALRTQQPTDNVPKTGTTVEVFAQIVVPAAPRTAVAEGRLPRMDEKDFRFADAPADPGLAELAGEPLPPGTVMILVEPSPREDGDWAAGETPFLAEF